jgi:hypothetical protein
VNFGQPYHALGPAAKTRERRRSPAHRCRLERVARRCRPNVAASRVRIPVRNIPVSLIHIRPVLTRLALIRPVLIRLARIRLALIHLFRGASSIRPLGNRTRRHRSTRSRPSNDVPLAERSSLRIGMVRTSLVDPSLVDPSLGDGRRLVYRSSLVSDLVRRTRLPMIRGNSGRPDRASTRRSNRDRIHHSVAPDRTARV